MLMGGSVDAEPLQELQVSIVVQTEKFISVVKRCESARPRRYKHKKNNKHSSVVAVHVACENGKKQLIASEYPCTPIIEIFFSSRLKRTYINPGM